MKAFLKKEQRWVEIDTKHLFFDQYNTVENKRIYDNEIEKIEDDVRPGKGKCKYCGKIVNIGEEEGHFAEEEAKTCEGCFWWQNETIRRETIHGEAVTTKLPDGTFELKDTIHNVSVYRKKCSYSAEKYGCDCTNKEHRRMGIEWFTAENTFFLKYPNGLPKYTPKTVEVPESCRFRKISGTYYKHEHKIGTYWLSMYVDNGKIDHFAVANCRNRLHFMFDDEGNTIMKQWNSWSCVEALPIPDAVWKKVKKICEEVIY